MRSPSCSHICTHSTPHTKALSPCRGPEGSERTSQRSQNSARSHPELRVRTLVYPVARMTCCGPSRNFLSNLSSDHTPGERTEAHKRAFEAGKGLSSCAHRVNPQYTTTRRETRGTRGSYRVSAKTSSCSMLHLSFIGLGTSFCDHHT